jgi:hypothetical protein
MVKGGCCIRVKNTTTATTTQLHPNCSYWLITLLQQIINASYDSIEANFRFVHFPSPGSLTLLETKYRIWNYTGPSIRMDSVLPFEVERQAFLSQVIKSLSKN